MRNVGGSSRSACTAPSTSTRGALSPPIASTAMLITSVFDRHPLLAAVVAAGRAHVVRPLQITAARARLERDVRRLVVGAAGAFLPFGGPSLGYGHGMVLCSVAGLAFEGGEGLQAGTSGRRTAAGARIQVLAAARAHPAAVLPAYDPLRRRQQQLLSHRGPQVDLRGVARQGVAVRVLQGVGILRKQGANVRQDRKSTRPNSSHGYISYAVFCLKKKTHTISTRVTPSLPDAIHLLVFFLTFCSTDSSSGTTTRPP